MNEIPEFDDDRHRERPADEDAGRFPGQRDVGSSEGRGELAAALVGNHAPGRDATPVEDGRADDSLLARAAREFAGDARKEVLADILIWLAEQGELAGSKPRAAHPESHWQSLCIKLLRINEYIKRHGGGPVVFYAAHHAWGIDYFDDINGHLTPTAFAETQTEKTFDLFSDADGKASIRKVERPLTKQAVNKAVKDAQEFFQLPERPEQRNEESRTKQRTAREKQLKQKK